MIWFVGVWYGDEDPETFTGIPEEHRLFEADTSDEALGQAAEHWSWLDDEYEMVGYAAVPIQTRPRRIQVTRTVEFV